MPADDEHKEIVIFILPLGLDVCGRDLILGKETSRVTSRMRDKANVNLGQGQF